jgi:crotonobetainyl-CoA:carnitine CoA-transferase CaiB-like acyl-CoA transferase
MAKSFRNFCEEQYDDEWSNDDEFRSKKDRLKERKQKQRQKNNEKMSSYEAKDDE